MTETLLDVARVMARRATCSRAHVGVVFARDGRVLATGYNGAPRGIPHCDHPDDERSTGDGDALGCAHAVHAEANAVAFAAQHGIALGGSELYTTHTPCVACAQLILNAGARQVFAGARYRDLAGVRLLERGGVMVFTLGVVTTSAGPALTWVRDVGDDRPEVPEQSDHSRRDDV